MRFLPNFISIENRNLFQEAIQPENYSQEIGINKVERGIIDRNMVRFKVDPRGGRWNRIFALTSKEPSRSKNRR